MSNFKDIFNRSIIYDTFFLNIKTVLTYPTLEKLEVENKQLFENWVEISKTKFSNNFNDTPNYFNDVYQTNAPNIHEFVKIITISYANVQIENEKIKRTLKIIANDDELKNINEFVEVLQQISSDGAQSSPKFFPVLCGYDIINNDIPLLIKKIFQYKDKVSVKKIPLILKESLNIKPWESGIIDIYNVWKFNGFNGTSSIQLISDFLGLKKTTEILTQSELSKFYWDNIENNPNNTFETIKLQSATQTNICIQFINELRQF